MDPMDVDQQDLGMDLASGDACVTPEKSPVRENFSNMYLNKSKDFMDWFLVLEGHEQSHFVKNLLVHMDHLQHCEVHQQLGPMLQRDFIGNLANSGFIHAASLILSYLDPESLANAQCVSKTWYQVVLFTNQWKTKIEEAYHNDGVWQGMCDKRLITSYLFKAGSPINDPLFYKQLYPLIQKEITSLNWNWEHGRPVIHRIACKSETSKGVYCLQYDDEKIVSGLRDNTIKIWDRKTLNLEKVLTGHAGSVLCLQYDDQIIVSGSSDSSVRVWNVKTGESLNTLSQHNEAVLHLRFRNGIMVTCSKDRQIAVWEMKSPFDIKVKKLLSGHRAAVNVVDFDSQYIVSASGDRTIKVWDTASCEFRRTLNGHRRGIACLQYQDKLIVSGSSDNTIRIWDVDSGNCLKQLEGHDELVRCIRFNQFRIVSGAYDGKIKIWNLNTALQNAARQSSCFRTLNEHSGRVFRLQFDHFQVVSSSHDDSIIIWDFDEPILKKSRLVSYLSEYSSAGPKAIGDKPSTSKEPLFASSSSVIRLNASDSSVGFGNNAAQSDEPFFDDGDAQSPH